MRFSCPKLSPSASHPRYKGIARRIALLNHALWNGRRCWNWYVTFSLKTDIFRKGDFTCRCRASLPLLLCITCIAKYILIYQIIPTYFNFMFKTQWSKTKKQTKARNPYTCLHIRHASCGVRFQCIWISCVNAHVSVYKDTLSIYLCILIVSVYAHAYEDVHMDS